jgi:hypothetical protein
MTGNPNSPDEAYTGQPIDAYGHYQAANGRWYQAPAGAVASITSATIAAQQAAQDNATLLQAVTAYDVATNEASGALGLVGAPVTNTDPLTAPLANAAPAPASTTSSTTYFLYAAMAFVFFILWRKRHKK